MTRVLGYSSNGTGWNKMTQEVYDPIDEAEARRRHDAGETYTAVLDVDDTIVTVASIADFGVTVAYYDSARTKVLESRDFRELADGQLWLRGINRYNGGAGLAKPQRVAEWFTWPDVDEPALWQRFDADTPRGTVVEERSEWDASAHRIDRPAFGDLDALIAPGLLERVWPGVTPLPCLAP